MTVSPRSRLRLRTTSDFDRESSRSVLLSSPAALQSSKVGAPSGIGLKEIKHRIETHLPTRAAVENRRRWRRLLPGCFLCRDSVQTSDADEDRRWHPPGAGKPVAPSLTTLALRRVVVEDPAARGLDSASTANMATQLSGRSDPIKVTRTTLQIRFRSSLILITEATVSRCQGHHHRVHFSRSCSGRPGRHANPHHQVTSIGSSLSFGPEFFCYPLGETRLVVSESILS